MSLIGDEEDFFVLFPFSLISIVYDRFLQIQLNVFARRQRSEGLEESGKNSSDRKSRVGAVLGKESGISKATEYVGSFPFAS